MKTQPAVFVGLLCVVVLVLRFVLPEIIVTVLLVTALFPLAESAGFSQWIIGFVILTIGESFLFPYQMPYYVQLREELAKRSLLRMLDETRLALFSFFLVIVKVAAIFASYYLWWGLGK